MEVKSSKDEDRVVEFIATDEVVDYDGDIVKVDGLDIKKIKKNKSFLWSHRHTDLPVGQIVSLKKDGKKLIGKAKMTSEDEYPFGNTIYKLIKGGYINNVSISFLPDYSTMEYQEKGGKNVRIINDSTLLEISAVNIGANPRAVITGKSLMETYEKAWDDEVIDGEELESLQKYTEEVSPEYTELVKKDIDIAVLQNKVNALELQVKELETESNEEDDWLAKIFSEYEASAADKRANDDQIGSEDEADEFDDYLNKILEE